MKQTAIDAKANELKEEGFTVEEIRRELFNTKGTRVAQIRKAIAQLDE